MPQKVEYDQGNIIYPGSNPVKPPPIPEVKESIIKRKLKHWKDICNDYITVSKDSYKYIKQNPAKSFKFAALATSIACCARLNPDMTSFEDQVLSYSAELGTLSPNIQNRLSAAHIDWIKQQFNLQKVKRLNLFIFSILYLEKTSPICCKYETYCSYLNLWPSEFRNRIVDIGFLNRWWILEKRMQNYDINF